MQPLTPDERQKLQGSLTTLRIIVFALIMGVTAFAAFGIYSQLQKAPQPQPAVPPAQMNIPQALAIAFAISAAVISFVVPPLITAPKLETDKTDSRDNAIASAAATLQMRTIIACSLLEGAAFFNAFYILTEFSLPNLAAVAVLVGLMALHFPLAGRYFAKIERLLGVDPFSPAAMTGKYQ